MKKIGLMMTIVFVLFGAFAKGAIDLSLHQSSVHQHHHHHELHKNPHWVPSQNQIHHSHHAHTHGCHESHHHHHQKNEKNHPANEKHHDHCHRSNLECCIYSITLDQFFRSHPILSLLQFSAVDKLYLPIPLDPHFRPPILT